MQAQNQTSKCPIFGINENVNGTFASIYNLTKYLLSLTYKPKKSDREVEKPSKIGWRKHFQ